MVAWWALVCFSVFFIGLTKSGFGSGVGLMIVPMAAIGLDHIPQRGAEAALGLLLPLLIVGDLIAVWQYRYLLGLRTKAGTADVSPPANGMRTWAILRRLLPGTAIGVVGGSLLLWWFHSQAAVVGALMRIEIGIESILLVGLHWWRTWRGEQHRLMPEPLRGHVTGSMAGVSSTLAHAAGPIIAMYLLPLRLDRRLYVGLCALYFFMLNTAKLPAYWAARQFDKAELSFTILFLPLVLVGALFGWWINKRLSDRLFTTVVYFLTFLLGWYIMIDGTMSLARHWK